MKQLSNMQNMQKESDDLDTMDSRESQEEIDKLIEDEDSALKKKRKSEKDKNWQPAQGAGVVPDKVWNDMPKDESSSNIIEDEGETHHG